MSSMLATSEIRLIARGSSDERGHFAHLWYLDGPVWVKLCDGDNPDPLGEEPGPVVEFDKSCKPCIAIFGDETAHAVRIGEIPRLRIDLEF